MNSRNTRILGCQGQRRNSRILAGTCRASGISAAETMILGEDPLDHKGNADGDEELENTTMT